MTPANVAKIIRRRQGHRPEGVAAACGISVATLYAIEGGKAVPRSDVLSRLADLYGVSTDTLLGRAPLPPELPRSAASQPGGTP